MFGRNLWKINVSHEYAQDPFLKTVWEIYKVFVHKQVYREEVELIVTADLENNTIGKHVNSPNERSVPHNGVALLRMSGSEFKDNYHHFRSDSLGKFHDDIVDALAKAVVKYEK